MTKIINTYFMEPIILTTFHKGLCMFCINPNSNFCTKHICLVRQMGYYSCGKKDCLINMFAVTQKWNEEKAYGSVKYLKDINFKILRITCEIQTGWTFNSPVVLIDKDGDDVIECIMNKTNLQRWCKVKMLCEQNPQVKINVDTVYYETPIIYKYDNTEYIPYKGRG